MAEESPKPPVVSGDSRKVEDLYTPIGDYGLLGDCHTAALVSRYGSVDWWCVPRFDSGSAFGRLLEHEGGGFCEVVPAAEPESPPHRTCRDDTLVLETTWRMAGGEAVVIDFLSDPDRDRPELVRIVDIRQAIDREGWDAKRRTFRQAFGDDALDAAVLRLPTLGFLEWDDERMVSTFSEIYSPRSGDTLGNFPQALTHPSHIEAALALAEAAGRPSAAIGGRASS